MSGAVEVAAFEVMRAGAAVVHVGLGVRQRGQQGPGLGGERVLGTVTCAVQPPDLAVGALLGQGLKHGDHGGGTDPGADQQYRRVRLVEDERASWCGDVELVANGEMGVQIAADGAAGFALDRDPVVGRPGWSGKRVVAQQRALALVGLDPQSEVLTGRAAGSGAPVGSSRRIEIAESLSGLMAVTVSWRKPDQAGGGLRP